MTTSLEHDVDHSMTRQQRLRHNPFSCQALPGERLYEYDNDEEEERPRSTSLSQFAHAKGSDLESDDVNEDDEEDQETVSPGATVYPRERHSIFLGKGKQATIVSRTVPIPTATIQAGHESQQQLQRDDNGCWTITVWEWEKPSAIIEAYWQVEHYGLAFGKHRHHMPLLDPFGLVAWPGAVVAAQELQAHADWIRNQRVVVLGAGVGMEVQAAAQLGAAHVVATDIHPTTLQLLQYGAEHAGLASRISTKLLDIGGETPLPECDVLIVADVLYNERLAWQVVQRIVEAHHVHNARVLVSDSQRFVTDFDQLVNQEMIKAQERVAARDDQHVPRLHEPVQWTPRWLPKFSGSGVLLDTDQTYEVKARTMWIDKMDADDQEAKHDPDTDMDSSNEKESRPLMP